MNTSSSRRLLVRVQRKMGRRIVYVPFATPWREEPDDDVLFAASLFALPLDDGPRFIQRRAEA